MRPIIAFAAGVTLLTVGFDTNAFAQEKKNKFTICIGDVCQKNVPGSADYIYDCSFAHANATNTDKAAADRVCLFENNFSSVGFYQRYDVGGGGNCGYIFVTVKCN
jgi:hypothetical protein